MRARLTGLHKATKRLSGGRVAVYAYAGRGGPLVARGEGRSLEAANTSLERALGTPEALATLQAARQPRIRAGHDRAYVLGLIQAFKASPEWTKLSPSSQVEYARYLDAFGKEFGDWKVSLFDKPGAKVDLLDWRDDTWGDKPRAADYAISTVGRLFAWARGRGLTTARPTDDVERVHRANRSDVVWSEDDLSRVVAKASKEVAWALRFAAETGFRLGDLIRVQWGAVGENGIVWRTRKTGRQVVVPFTPNARQLLADLPKRALTVLTNSYGEPWTEGGLKHMIREARIAAGVTGLRLHDLRGTAATRLYLAGSPKRDIATIMGWSEETVDALLTKYVSGDAVALDLQRRMNQKPPAQTGDKPASRSASK